MKLTPKKALKKKAEELKASELEFRTEAHKKRANKIALMFFNGNFRSRPKMQSIYRFSINSRENWEIRKFLGCTKEQKQYNY